MKAILCRESGHCSLFSHFRTMKALRKIVLTSFVASFFVSVIVFWTEIGASLGCLLPATSSPSVLSTKVLSITAHIDGNYKVVGSFSPLVDAHVKAYRITVSYPVGKKYVFSVPSNATTFVDWHAKQSTLNTYSISAIMKDGTVITGGSVTVAMWANGEAVKTGTGTKTPPPPVVTIPKIPPITLPDPKLPPPVTTWTGAPRVGSCQIFPSDNAWNTDISNYPVHKNSANFINSIGASGHLHADFWEWGAYGIPYIVVDKTQPMKAINFTAYGDESDPGPYPIPLNAPIEGGSSSTGDRHVIAVDKNACMLYELYRAFPKTNSWDADSAAKFDLSSNALRPAGWTSADAAGLPIFPGLARYDEVASGTMNHALRFTVVRTQKAYISPARHYASNSTDPNLPPMGLRLRLKANYDISKFTGQTRVVLNTLKKYGMIVADNGSNWFISGDANSGWNDNDLNALKTVPGSAFEAIDMGK